MSSHNIKSIFTHRYVKYFIPCLFLGLCVVFLYPSTSLHETDIVIPVDYRQIPAGLAVTRPPITGVEVRISGPKAKIKALSDLKLRYELDLSGVNIGLNFVPINQDQIQLPSGISIVKISPPQVTLSIEHEIEKTLPVKISLSGKLATGHVVASTIARPLSVTLRGPEAAISAMEEAFTKPIDIKGLAESFKKEIALDIAEEVQVVGSSNIIFAEVRIAEEITTKNIKDILVKGNGTPYGYKITPPTIDIDVKGPANVIDKIDKENSIDVYVDLQGLKPGVYIRRASINLPVKTTLVGVKPEIFTIKITKGKADNLKGK